MRYDFLKDLSKHEIQIRKGGIGKLVVYATPLV
jgi:hypothetical protein